MLSVVITAQDGGRPLVATLSALVPGAVAGLVREVIVTGDASRDVVEIADVAGCRVITSDAPNGARLKAAAAAARSSWLLFLKPGWIPDQSWIGETRAFIETSELSGRAEKVAAVYRRAPSPGAPRPPLKETMSLLIGAFSGRPRPEQGILIAKRLYDRLDGHDEAEDAESDMLRRLRRRQIVTLHSMAATALAWTRGAVT